MFDLYNPKNTNTLSTGVENHLNKAGNNLFYKYKQGKRTFFRLLVLLPALLCHENIWASDWDFQSGISISADYSVADEIVNDQGANTGNVVLDSNDQQSSYSLLPFLSLSRGNDRHQFSLLSEIELEQDLETDETSANPQILARSSHNFFRNSLSLASNVSLSETRANQAITSIPTLGLLSDSESTEFLNYQLSAIYRTTTQAGLNIGTALSYQESLFEDQSDQDLNTRRASASVGQSPGILPFSWSVSANSQTTESNFTSQERELINYRATAGFTPLRNLQINGSVGYDTFSIGSNLSEANSVFWGVNSVWTPLNNVQVRLGYDSGVLNESPFFSVAIQNNSLSFIFQARRRFAEVGSFLLFDSNILNQINNTSIVNQFATIEVLNSNLPQGQFFFSNDNTLVDDTVTLGATKTGRRTTISANLFFIRRFDFGILVDGDTLTSQQSFGNVYGLRSNITRNLGRRSDIGITVELLNDDSITNISEDINRYGATVRYGFRF